MEQKRFLTADEVFQLFGVDASALEVLVGSGAVKALTDSGSFKYRSEDFVALVNSGTLAPRSSGELFQVDSDGNIPFLNPKNNQPDVRIDDQVSFLELDEDALNEQANGPETSATPDSDSDVRIAGLGQTEIAISDRRKAELAEELMADTIGAPAVGHLKSTDSDSDVRLAPLDSEEVVESGGTDFEMNSLHTDDSDIKLIASADDSGISLVRADSGIRLDGGDSGISLVGDDSGISLHGENSSASPTGGDSGIRVQAADSGISLVGADSGISLLGADSGISLHGADSGISLGGGDSGITLEDDVFDPDAGAGNLKRIDVDPGKGGKKETGSVKKGSDASQTLDLSDELTQDSGFDVNLAEEDQTAELNLNRRGDSTPGFPATVASKGGPKTNFGGTGPTLSETFQMDEPPEVEDLDISDDLEGAPASDFSDEFAAVEEEDVFEASDADFSEAEVSVAEEEEFSDDEALTPAAKVRKGPKEPEWGMLAVGPIACASLLMLATVTVLWGGVATMWTGAEAPGPAATLISTLAGLSPF